jgi:hypothetical protein
VRYLKSLFATHSAGQAAAAYDSGVAAADAVQGFNQSPTDANLWRPLVYNGAHHYHAAVRALSALFLTLYELMRTGSADSRVAIDTLTHTDRRRGNHNMHACAALAMFACTPYTCRQYARQYAVLADCSTDAHKAYSLTTRACSCTCSSCFENSRHRRPYRGICAASAWHSQLASAARRSMLGFAHDACVALHPHQKREESQRTSTCAASEDRFLLVLMLQCKGN